MFELVSHEPVVSEELIGESEDERVELALKYLDHVKHALSEKPKMYNTFLKIMKCFKHEQIDASTMIQQVSVIFGDRMDLTLGLNMFLPPGFRIVPTKNAGEYADGKTEVIQTGVVLEDSHTSGVSRTKENDNEQLQEETVTGDRPNQLVIQNNHGNGPVLPQCVEGRSFNFVARSTATDAYQRLLNVNKNSIVNPEAAPEFYSAVNFVKGIKERFAGNPEIFRAFLDILHPRDGKERPVDEILIQVSKIFSNHQDLLDHFKTFMQTGGSEIILKKETNTTQLKRLRADNKDDDIAIRKFNGDSKRRIPQVEETDPSSQSRGSVKQPYVRPVLVDRLPITPAPCKQRGDTSGLSAVVKKPQRSSSLKRKCMNDSENGKEGVSKGKNTAKIKGKDDKKKRNRTKVVENVSLTPGYQLFSADDSTVLTKLLPSQRRSERVMQEKRGRIRAAAGSHNGSTSSTTTVDSGVPVEDVAFLQYEDDTFLLKAKESFTRRCRLAWEDFLVCLELYSSKKMDRHVLLEVVFDICGGDRAFFEGFIDFLERCTTHHNAEAYNSDENVDYNASVPLNRLDFSECSSCTPSYRELPSAYQSSYCSAKGELEKSVLNDKWVSVPHYSVDTDQFKHMQQNYAEMRLFELEEDYFEVGLSTISQLEPILAEIKALEKIERHCNFSEYSKEFADTKEDRLPIFAKFSIAENSLDRVHFAMIRRLYGVYGNQIVESLNNNPREAVPVILERLKKKVSEWRHIQKNNSKSNNFVATTFAESFDHQSESFKLYSKSLYTSKALFKDLKQVNWPHDKGEPLRVEVPQDTSLRKIFANDVNALLNIAAGSDMRFISHNLKAQTDALKHIDSSCGGFISFLLGVEDPHLSEQHIQMQDDLNLSDLEKPSNHHHSESDEEEKRNTSSTGPDGGSGSSKNTSGNDVVCSYVGTEEVYLVIRLYLLFMLKLQTAWILFQSSELRHDSLISHPHKTVLEHANLTQFSTAESNAYLSSTYGPPEMFTLYRGFLGLVGALLGGIITKEMYEKSIRQLMGIDSYKFLFLDELTSEFLLHLSRIASKKALVNKLEALARYEHQNLINSGIPLTWTGTIMKARKILNSFPSSEFDCSMCGLFVMLIENDGTLEFRNVTALENPGKQGEEKQKQT